MSKIEEGLLYTKTNEWVKVEESTARVGIDDYSQNEFGEIVYIDLPEIGQQCNKDNEICVIESVKTASDIYSPLSGKIVRVNQELLDNPRLINIDCYDQGWLFEIELSDSRELSSLMSADKYRKYVF